MAWKSLSLVLLVLGIGASVTIAAEQTSDASTPSYTGGPECALCKTVVKELFNFLRQNKTEENIVKGLDRVCHMIYPSQPSLDQCQAMVKAYTRELVQLLVDETDPKVICTLLDQCVYSKEPERQQIDEMGAVLIPLMKMDRNQKHDLAHLIAALDSSIEVNSLRSCVECKMFIKYLKDKLENPQSVAELKEWLSDNLCKELPDNGLVDYCKSMVENYSDVFFKAVAGDLNPQSACVELGVCSAKSVIQVLNIGRQPTFSVSNKRLRPSRRPIVNTICTTCTDIVSYMDEYLATRQLVNRSTWYNACSKAADQTDCGSIVNTYGPDIIQMIPTMESPRDLCKQIALC